MPLRCVEICIAIAHFMCVSVSRLPSLLITQSKHQAAMQEQRRYQGAQRDFVHNLTLLQAAGRADSRLLCVSRLDNRPPCSEAGFPAFGRSCGRPCAAGPIGRSFVVHSVGKKAGAKRAAHEDRRSDANHVLRGFQHRSLARHLLLGRGGGAALRPKQRRASQTAFRASLAIAQRLYLRMVSRSQHGHWLRALFTARLLAQTVQGQDQGPAVFAA